tara:strand:- start:1051 stop:1485 length:435 start_codon:yes stop_codon:yes gene_type:complete
MISTNSLFMFSIICTPKHHAFNEGGDLWCFDYTFADGSLVKDEPLMPEATELINRLLTVKYEKEIFEKGEDINKIEITFSNDAIENYDLCLEYLEPAEDGSHYIVRDGTEYLSMTVWLCPVFDQFFTEERPKELYVTVTKAEED